jgi:hypothetical protein
MIFATSAGTAEIWLVPNLAALLAGAVWWILRRNRYQIPLWGLSAITTISALFAAWAQGPVRAAPSDFDFVGFWWESGCVVSIPCCFAVSASYVWAFYNRVVDRC